MESFKLDLERPFNDAISRIRFAPNSNNLLSSSWDSVLRLYDVSRSVLRLEAQSEGALLDCCFQDESVAFSASSDGCLRRYCLCSGTQSIVGRSDDAITCIEFSDDNVVHDLRNLEDPVEAKGFSMKNQIQCVRAFSNSQGYTVGSVDGHVALQSLEPGYASELGCVFRCHPKSKDRHHLVAINDVAFHPKENAFVTGDYEGYAIVWDAQSRKRLFEFKRYPAAVASLSYSPSGQFLAIASSYTYQEANEAEETPQIFVHEMV